MSELESSLMIGLIVRSDTLKEVSLSLSLSKEIDISVPFYILKDCKEVACSELKFLPCISREAMDNWLGLG